jgi:hypothetical protein
VQLDGKPRPLKSLPATASIPTDNLSVWRRYVSVDIPLVDLARWGHQQPGAPWEAGHDIASTQTPRLLSAAPA